VKRAKRCVMAWAAKDADGNEKFEQCIRTPIPGDEVCEPCRASIEKLLHNAQIAQQFRKVLNDSVNTPHAKNGHRTPSGHHEESP
jgi:hypothetical protein